jgi:hypothetical protein
MSRLNLSELKPWAGLLAGMLGAGLQHQLVSDAMHFDCRHGGNDLVAGIGALVLIAIGALLSWSALRSHPDPESPRRFVAVMSLMAAALFALMVCWQTLAGWIRPACLP